MASNFRSVAVITALGSVLTSSFANDARFYDIPLSAPHILNFTLLSSDLTDVQSKLGQVSQQRISADEEAPIEICYESSKAADKTILIFESGSSGGWVKISGFSLTEINDSLKLKCSSSAAITDQTTVLDGHIRLDMTKEEVLSSLGPPRNNDSGQWGDLPPAPNQDSNHWIYITTWKVPFSKQDLENAQRTFGSLASLGLNPHWDASVQLTLDFSESKLNKISVRYSLSD